MAQSDLRTNFTATIALGGSLSAAVVLGDLAPVGIVIPATGAGDFAATTARIVFQVSADGTTYNVLKDNDGTLVTLTVAENNTLGATHLSPDKFRAWRFLKVGTYAADGTTAVVQAAAKSLTIIADKVSG